MHMKVSPIIWKLDLSCKTLTLMHELELDSPDFPAVNGVIDPVRGAFQLANLENGDHLQLDACRRTAMVRPAIPSLGVMKQLLPPSLLIPPRATWRDTTKIRHIFVQIELIPASNT